MKANLKARKTDPAIAPLACNFYALRRVWNQAKQKATPWWRQCSKETYECGIADLVAALQNWSDANVRRPLRQLQLRGLIEARQGKGRFVRIPSPIAIILTADNYRRHQREGRRGFDAQVPDQGHTPHQEIIEVATVPAPPEVTGRLGLQEGAAVVMRRLRFMVDNQPVQLVKLYTIQGAWEAASSNNPWSSRTASMPSCDDSVSR